MPKTCSFLKNPKLMILVFFLVLRIFLAPRASAAWCDQTCGGRRLPYPFGFSPACQIQLNCTDGTIFAADFPVESFTSDTLLINVPAKCGRPVERLGRLFTRNYAPTAFNAILLQNCSGKPSGCFIPTTAVSTSFQLVDCGKKNDSISCYSETGSKTGYIDYKNLTRRGCRSLFSAISTKSLNNASSVSLEVQIVRIGWWLLGECRCSENARCVPVTTPLVDENPAAYRCQCLEGYAGDGFHDGSGCRKEWQRCNASKYLPGQCGGVARIGVLAGGVAAGASLIAGLALVFCFIRKRSKRRRRVRKMHQLCEDTGIAIPVYPYREMEKATDSFSDKRRLGNGAYGTVYSGKLNNDEWVAIKRIRHRDAPDITEQVINEVKLLSSVNHPNLVRLLGCSIEIEQQILVYEFMPNGTLSQHLQRERGNGLPWLVRLTIAAETAQAISYLHNAMQPPIYHRDVKSSNILLDYNYKSKVADFGLSRLGKMESSHVSTAPQGTPGYLDPQYHQNFQLSDKSDVYSFGVVLAEIITGLRTVDFSRPHDEVNLASLAVNRIGTGRLDEIVDPFNLEPDRDAWTLSSVRNVAELAFRCLAFHRDMRPSMVEVAIELERIRLSKWADSELSIVGSSEATSSSSSTNLSEKPLNLPVKQLEGGSSNSLDPDKDSCPVSVQDSWQSDPSSPSSNGLPNPVVR